MFTNFYLSYSHLFMVFLVQLYLKTMAVHHKIKSKWYFCKRYNVFISVCDKAAKLPSVEKLMFSPSLVTLDLANSFRYFN